MQLEQHQTGLVLNGHLPLFAVPEVAGLVTDQLTGVFYRFAFRDGDVVDLNAVSVPTSVGPSCTWKK